MTTDKHIYRIAHQHKKRFPKGADIYILTPGAQQPRLRPSLGKNIASPIQVEKF